MKKIILFSALSLLIFACTKSHEGMTKATIRDYTGFDGCGMLIVLENGDEIGAMSICMVGSTVEIDELEER